jgi:hypothetical protein
MRLSDGRVIALAHGDARELVAALWKVTATSGAVVAIGKIEHRLTGAADPVLDFSELEGGAIRAALDQVERGGRLTPALGRLRTAIE